VPLGAFSERKFFEKFSCSALFTLKISSFILESMFCTRLFSMLFFLMFSLSFFSSLRAGTVESKNFDQSHRLFTQVLKKNLKESKHSSTVNYQQLKGGSQLLDQYLVELSSVKKDQFRSWNDSERLSFLINVYNAFTLKLIIDHYPLKSIKDIPSGLFSSPWKKKFFKLFGKKTSLNVVEHQMIRKNFNEPRIHFAVNCASIGCPKLISRAFVASQLKMQLEGASLNFIQDESRNRFEKGALHVSKIFDWYGGDFGNKKSLRKFIVSRMDLSMEERKVALSTPIKFLDYDWNLNQHR